MIEAARYQGDLELPHALADPGFYPGRPVDVEVHQTHISWVFIAGDRVYKLKKPVRFGFLDYSTPALRLRFCEEEVRLNRRLAPSVYLDVLPIVRRGHGFALGVRDGSDHDVVDYVVVMRRLPADRMLDRCLARGEAGMRDLDRVATKLAAFHAACPDRGDRYGSVAAIRELVLENLSECAPAVGVTLAERQRSAIEQFFRGFVAEHVRLLEARAAGGRIREGHGDLRAEHVCLAADIDVFDCVEFSERLRSCDVASEIAFLAMDLDYLGEPVLADGFATAYSAIAGDATLATVLPFYRCYRALVRGKVELLRSREPEVEEDDREAAREASRRYFRLSTRYARSPRPRALVVVCGLSGTGKSTVARIVGDLTGFPVFNSDVVRKDLAGVPRFAHVEGERAAVLYGAESTRRTYDGLLARAREMLATRRGVVLDATYRESGERRRLIELAAEENVPVRFLECRASKGEVLRRLAARNERSGEASDADSSIYLRQREEARAFEDIPDDVRVAVDTEKPVDALAADLEALV